METLTPSKEVLAMLRNAAQDASYMVYTNPTGSNNAWISFSQAGQVLISYYYNTDPANVYIWHQGGGTTPVQQGSNVYTIGAWDYLVYQLPSDGTSIKLSWQYQ